MRILSLERSLETGIVVITRDLLRGGRSPSILLISLTGKVIASLALMSGFPIPPQLYKGILLVQVIVELLLNFIVQDLL